MLGKHKIWDIQEYNREKAGFYAAELGISSLVTGILLERGFSDVDSMRDFLYGSKTPFHDPFLLKGMRAHDAGDFTCHGGLFCNDCLHVFLLFC